MDADLFDARTQSLACVVLAHSDPAQVQRLVRALDPFPVFLHCDSRTPDAVHRAMTTGLPRRVTLLDRIPTPWAGWNLVEAEVAGYRAVLATGHRGHIAVLSGNDYPLASTGVIASLLDRHADQSFGSFDVLPRAPWGRSGGMSRVRYRHWVWAKRMLRIPVPRRLPASIIPAGGSMLKVLTAAHADLVVHTMDARPELVRFWRRTWCPDETFVHTVLASFEPGWDRERASNDLWFIDWRSGGKSPQWLDLAHLARLTDIQPKGIGAPVFLFARKFSTATSSELMDVIDSTLRIEKSPWSGG